MMIAYFDTSALAKRYVEEAGSDRVSHWLKEIEHLETSALTELELTAFLERCKREHRVDSPGYRRIMAGIERDIRVGMVSLVAMDQEILKSGKKLIQQQRLRVADSIQLATALSSHRRFSGSMHFVCADQALLRAARLTGLKCLDPTEEV